MGLWSGGSWKSWGAGSLLHVLTCMFHFAKTKNPLWDKTARWRLGGPESPTGWNQKASFIQIIQQLDPAMWGFQRSSPDEPCSRCPPDWLTVTVIVVVTVGGMLGLCILSWSQEHMTAGVVLEGLRVDAIFTCFSLFSAHEGSRHGKFAWQLGSCMVKALVESMTGQDCTTMAQSWSQISTQGCWLMLYTFCGGCVAWVSEVHHQGHVAFSWLVCMELAWADSKVIGKKLESTRSSMAPAALTLKNGK